MEGTTQPTVKLNPPEETGPQIKRTESTLAIWRFKVSKLKREGKPVPASIALPWVYVNSRVYYRQSDIDEYLSRLKPTLETRRYRKPQRPSPGRPRGPRGPRGVNLKKRAA